MSLKGDPDLGSSNHIVRLPALFFFFLVTYPLSSCLRQLADEVDKPLSITFEKPWHSSEVHTDWKRRNISPVFKKGKKGRARELQPSQSSLFSQQEHGADPSGNDAKAYRK